jgi:iron(III) transport system substrate-binding protein
MINIAVCLLFAILCAFEQIAHAQQTPLNLLEKAKAEPRLVVYGDTNLRDLQMLTDGFRAKYSFIKQVEALSLPIDRLFAKLSTEFQAGVYNPDVITMSAGQTVQAKQAGWLAKYLSSEAQFYGKGFKDADGFWYSNYMNTNVIAFNTRMTASETAPKNYQDLLHPRWKGKLGINNAHYRWLINMLEIMGEKEGLAYMRQLARQDLHPGNSQTLLIQLLAAGEISAVVNVNGHAVEQFRVKGAPVDWVGVNPVIVSVHPIAVSAKASSPSSARLFVDFALSKDGQRLVSDMQRIPTRLDVPPKMERLAKGLTLRPSDPVFEVNNLQRGEKLFREIFKL